MLFQKVLADSAQIVEDAQSQCQKGHIIKINAQVVAYIDQKCCQQSVGKEAGDKNPVIKGALAGCPDTAKYRVKGSPKFAFPLVLALVCEVVLYNKSPEK